MAKICTRVRALRRVKASANTAVAALASSSNVRSVAGPAKRFSRLEAVRFTAAASVVVAAGGTDRTTKATTAMPAAKSRTALGGVISSTVRRFAGWASGRSSPGLRIPSGILQQVQVSSVHLLAAIDPGQESGVGPAKKKGDAAAAKKPAAAAKKPVAHAKKPAAAAKPAAPAKKPTAAKTPAKKATAAAKTPAKKAAAAKKPTPTIKKPAAPPRLPSVPRKTTAAPPQWKIYVLELQGGKVYVGKSRDIPKRLKQHMSGHGASYTKRNPPTGKLLPRLGNLDGDGDGPERDETLRWINKLGPDNVRGWRYCTKNLTAADREDIESNLREMYDLCRRCGMSGHFAAECKSKTDRMGKALPPRKG